MSTTYTDRWLTWDGACGLLKLSKNALRHRMKRGSLPRTCWSTSLGNIRFDRIELDRFLEQGAADPAAEQLARLRANAPRSLRRAG